MRIVSMALFVGASVLAACQPAVESTVEVDHEAIAATIREALDVMLAGMNDHDVPRIMSVYAEDVLYVGEGAILEGLDALTEAVGAFHAGPGSEWSTEVDRVTVDVLSGDNALLTASGLTGPELSRGYSLTDVFERRGDAWVIVYEHESVSEPQTSDM
jgi:uncharacterized protein (TIGR02246 family)